MNFSLLLEKIKLYSNIFEMHGIKIEINLYRDCLFIDSNSSKTL